VQLFPPSNDVKPVVPSRIPFVDIPEAQA